MIPVHNLMQASKMGATKFAPFVQVKQQKHNVYRNFIRQMLKPSK